MEIKSEKPVAYTKIMTRVFNNMSTDTYWNRISYDPASYFDEFSINLINEVLDEDVDCFEAIIKQENDDFPSSPSSNEADQQIMHASSSDSPPTDSQTLNLLCRVCSAPAHGYNFDQITCESCKAFFRRNALRNTSPLKCRYSGNCEINMHTRRLCTHCRLKKCFDIKMKKEWIRTDEERELRRLRDVSKQQKKYQQLSTDQLTLLKLPIVLRKKKRIGSTLLKPIQSSQELVPVPTIGRMDLLAIHRNLAVDDQVLLNNIQQAYRYGAEKVNMSHIRNYTTDSSLSQFLNDETVNHQSLIFFYKNVHEFREFDLNDQILLIKCNLIDLIHLHHIVTQNFQELEEMGEHMSKWISQDFHIRMSGTRKRFDRFMKYPLVLQITLVVFIFSLNLSTPRGSSQFMTYKNQRKLHEYQNFYVTLLWRYLVYLFGEGDAIQSMTIIVVQILRYQILMKELDDCLRANNAHQDIFDPLMQSVFGLT